MTAAPVLAAAPWKDNAHLIADVARLYWAPGMSVLDVTYGRGNWWTVWRPDRFAAHDLYRGPACDGVDFRKLPEPGGSVDIVAFDPPYTATGGRSTSASVGGMRDAYGIDGGYSTADPCSTPDGLRAMIADGLVETRRVLRPRGLCWAKSMNYISGGRLRPGTLWLVEDAQAAGFELVDLFVHVGGTGPQPRTNPDGSPRRQAHARNNYSTLAVLRAPR